MSFTREYIGIILCTLATFFFALQDAVTKILVQKLPLMQFVMVRYWFFLIFALILASRSRVGVKGSFKTKKLSLQMLRSLLMVVEIMMFAWGLSYLALSDMHSLFILYPIFTTLLANPLLKEQLGKRVVIASGISFLGAILILRPGSGVFGLEALIPIGCALLFSFYSLLTRLISRYDHYTSNVVYSALVGVVLSTFWGLPSWQVLNSQEAFYLFLLVLMSVTSHILLIKALDLTDASMLQPFNYFTLVWAVLIGWIHFDEIPDWATSLGAISIVLSGLWVLKSGQVRRINII